MKIVHLSDTHGWHHGSVTTWLEEVAEQEKPDAIVHSGDFMKHAMKYEDFEGFINWFQKLPFQHKILVPGNHDMWAECLEYDTYLKGELLPHDIHLLICESVVIDGVKFYGSPYTPAFCNWGFQLRPYEQEVHWKNIPDDTDVLITHGPAKGILDYINIINGEPKEALGCEFLTKRIDDLNLQAHLFGHIHGAYGRKEESGYVALNSAILNESYKVQNKPQIVEVNSQV